jgi:ERCC4-type nuclease
MGNTRENPAPPSLRVVVDDRERRAGLAEAVAALWPPTFVGRLPVGDVEIGPRILVERKTMADFAASLADGRLFRQARAISRASPSPLMVLEGEDGFDLLDIPPNALRGVLLTLLVAYRIPLLRTASTSETALSLAQLARQEQRRNERKRNPRAAEKTAARTALEILGTIPGIGDEKARRLIHGLGSLKEVIAASERELRSVPGVGPRTAREIRRTMNGPGPV